MKAMCYTIFELTNHSPPQGNTMKKGWYLIDEFGRNC